MNLIKAALTVVLSVILVASALAQTVPKFPRSELKRGQEGWVVLDLSLDRNGQVVNLSVSDSSGNDTFNEAALEAARDWQLDADAAQQSSALINFVFDEKRTRLSKKFVSRYAKVHRAIDKGDLGDAEDRLAVIRAKTFLSASELAYSYLAEGRIAGERGDKATQLICFRKAMLSQGHWVTDETYGRLLYASVILGLQQQDVASAVRDYDLLLELESGPAMVASIEKTMQAARQFLADNDIKTPPYMAANHVVEVEEEAPRNVDGYDVYTGSGDGWSLSSDKADTPPPVSN